MDGFLTTVIIVSAIIIVFAVIMQPSKDGGLGGLASGGVTDSVFGTNRNEFLSKTTWWLMAIFLISSIVLAKHKTRIHNEKEAEVNTRSIAEEVSDTVDESKSVIQDAEKDGKDALEDVKKDLEKKADEVKEDAEETKSEIEKKVEDAVKEAEDKTESAVDKLKNSLPENSK